MEFEIILEKITGECVILNDAKELESEINKLANGKIGNGIVIEVEPAFDKVVALSVDYVETRDKSFFKKNRVIDTYYHVHAVVDIDADEDFINYYYKSKSYLEVRDMFLDFFERKRIPSVYNWSKDDKLF